MQNRLQHHLDVLETLVLDVLYLLHPIDELFQLDLDLRRLGLSRDGYELHVRPQRHSLLAGGRCPTSRERGDSLDLSLRGRVRQRVHVVALPGDVCSGGFYSARVQLCTAVSTTTTGATTPATPVATCLASYCAAAEPAAITTTATSDATTAAVVPAAVAASTLRPRNLRQNRGAAGGRMRSLPGGLLLRG